jgi:outer membrane protein OmpA-like peptidoglycan-associated protein
VRADDRPVADDIDWNRVGEILDRLTPDEQTAAPAPAHPHAGEPPLGKPRTSTKGWIPVAILVPVVALGGYFGITTRGNGDVAAAPVTTAAPVPAPTTSETPASTSILTSTTSPSTSAATTSSTSASTTTTVAADVQSAPPAGAQVIASPDPSFPQSMAAPGNGLYADGRLYMRGPIGDVATAQGLIERAGSVLGPENLVYEFWIVPGTPVPEGTVEVADTILFTPGSAEIDAQFAGTLDLAAAFLTLYPNVSLRVTGHTDSVGDELSNLALSQQRVDAIVTYYLAAGIDLSRIEAIAAGESDPKVEELTPADRAVNRRVEFQFVNVLS